MTCNLIT